MPEWIESIRSLESGLTGPHIADAPRPFSPNDQSNQQNNGVRLDWNLASSFIADGVVEMRSVPGGLIIGIFSTMCGH